MGICVLAIVRAQKWSKAEMPVNTGEEFWEAVEGAIPCLSLIQMYSVPLEYVPDIYFETFIWNMIFNELEKCIRKKNLVRVKLIRPFRADQSSR